MLHTDTQRLREMRAPKRAWDELLKGAQMEISCSLNNLLISIPLKSDPVALRISLCGVISGSACELHTRYVRLSVNAQAILYLFCHANGQALSSASRMMQLSTISHTVGVKIEAKSWRLLTLRTANR